VCDAGATPLRVAVYRKETLWFHTSNPLAWDAVQRLGRERSWTIQAFDPNDMTAERLREVDAVLLLLSSGDALSDTAMADLSDFVRRGGGLAGVHSATFTEPSRPEMRELLGARFRTHPAIQPGVVRRVGTSVLGEGLPDTWPRTDEWYTFEGQPYDVPGLQVLFELVEPEDYPADAKMGRHPLAWTRELGTGRVFYTAMGHTDESYAEPLFLRHLAQGVEWAAAPRRTARACE